LELFQSLAAPASGLLINQRRTEVDGWCKRLVELKHVVTVHILW
jgi:hypothetical protein